MERKNIILCIAASIKKPSARAIARAVHIGRIVSVYHAAITEGRWRELECWECSNENCEYAGTDFSNYQRCLHCQFAMDPAGEECQLCFDGSCGFEEKVE